MEARSIPPRVYAGGGGGGRGGILMTELALFAGHNSSVVGAGSLSSWPFDCYHDQKRPAVPPAAAFGVPAGAFSIDCLLTGRHRIDDAALQLRPTTDSLNLLHINKLARTTDIDGQFPFFDYLCVLIYTARELHYSNINHFDSPRCLVWATSWLYTNS